MSRNYKGKRKQRRGPAVTTIFMGLGALAVVVAVIIGAIVLKANWETVSQKFKVEKKVRVKKEKVVEQIDTEETEESEETEETVVEPSYVVITSNGDEQQYDSCYRIGDSAYEMYTYSEKMAKAYASAVNSCASQLSGKSQVYVMPVPLSSGITIPDVHLNTDLFGNQHQAIQNINSLMSSSVKTIDAYDSLMEHRGEYVYFRTDHHWTATGAYYAYEDFCELKGITPNSLSSYRTDNYEGYLGSFYYNGTGRCEKLGENPDTVVAYHPLSSEATMEVTQGNGQTFQCGVIYDETGADASLIYGAFIAGDNAFSEITNPSKTDGSACIIVKESFGNAYVPFMVDHYEKVYVIDYRYWDGSIVELAKEKNAEDILFINNLSALRDSTRVGEINKVI